MDENNEVDKMDDAVVALAGEGKPRVCILNPMAYITNSSGDITDSKKLQLTARGENIAEECGVSSNESCISFKSIVPIKIVVTKKLSKSLNRCE